LYQAYEVQTKLCTPDWRAKENGLKNKILTFDPECHTHQVSALPFMQRKGWRKRDVQKALKILATIPRAEHEAINTFFMGHYVFRSVTGVAILHNLSQYSPAQRAHLYTLAASREEAEYDLAYTLAAQKWFGPDPESQCADDLMCGLEQLRKDLTLWWTDYQEDPWSAELEALDQGLAALQDRCRAMARRAEEAHQESLARHIAAFQAKGGDAEGTALMRL
jgi:hypothetical protein